MANDKFLNYTGLDYYHSRVKTLFPSTSEFNALEDKVDEIIAEGGEPNVIEVVQQNGTALPVTNKTVNVTVPTTVAELSDSSDYALKTDVPTDAEIEALADGRIADSISSSTTSSIASKQYVADNGGKIDTIKVNGTAQTITNKAVDITVPTKVSDLTNDSDFQTAQEVEDAIDAKVVGVFTYKGSVATVADLPSTGNKKGDVYDVQETGVNYAWDGTKWDALGSYVDTSLLWAKSELTAITTAEIDTIIA